VLRFGVCPACHNSEMGSALRIAAMEAIEVPGEHYTFDEVDRW
jgi:hypothetical protein